MKEVIAQISESTTGGIPGLVVQFGFGGVVLLMVHKGLERIEHTLRGLSKALWMDLASRPYTDKIIRDQANKIVAEMDAERKK
tara:strand:- start:101 stop:349 length:249 start_codon:yes stop_codon:yes gene_type:complete